MQSIKKWLHGIVMFAILSVVSMAASATLITSFEGGSTLADNGMTLTQGITSRANIQLSATSGLTTLTPTDSTHLLKMTAGTEADIINPSFPSQLVTLVDFNNSVNINKPYFLVDFAFMNRDSSGRNDRQRIGINGILYDITGSAEAGNSLTYIPTWQTLAIHFASLGSINLSLGCLNDTLNGGSSYCLWDNFRTADFAPTAANNGNRPVVSPFGPISLESLPPSPPATAVPEPGTAALMLLGLLGLGATRKRGQVPSKEG